MAAAGAEAQAGGPAVGAPGVGAPEAEEPQSVAATVGDPAAAAGVPDSWAGVLAAAAGGVLAAGAGLAQLGLVAELAEAASGLANPELVEPGLANPAPVSSRARAAAASVDVLSSPPSSASGCAARTGLAALAELAELPEPAALPDFAALSDFAARAGAGGSPESALPLAFVTLSGPGTASALPLAADFFSAAAHTESLGTVASVRGPSADLANDGGVAASDDDEPFLDPA